MQRLWKSTLLAHSACFLILCRTTRLGAMPPHTQNVGPSHIDHPSKTAQVFLWSVWWGHLLNRSLCSSDSSLCHVDIKLASIGQIGRQAGRHTDRHTERQAGSRYACRQKIINRGEIRRDRDRKWDDGWVGDSRVLCLPQPNVVGRDPKWSTHSFQKFGPHRVYKLLEARICLFPTKFGHASRLLWLPSCSALNASVFQVGTGCCLVHMNLRTDGS